MNSRVVETLALDIEGTLISNAISQFPRPGLYGFLEFCKKEFPRVVVYTAVRERRFRMVAYNLIREGSVPPWFGHLPHVYWSGDYKDLREIPDAAIETTLLVDDFEECVHPDQKSRWIQIAPYERPYPSSDVELARIQRVLIDRTR